MEALVDALLDWIGRNSDYDTNIVERPAIIELSPSDLTREYYLGLAHLLPDDGVDERLNALFAVTDGPHGTIYLLAPGSMAGAEDFDDPTDNPLWREILLHELVHFVQWQSGAWDAWACPALGEPEAYRLGGRYLRQRRVTDPLPNRNFWGAIYGRC